MKKISIIYALLSMLCSFSAFAENEFDYNRWNSMLQRIQDRAIAERISPHIIDEVIQEASFKPDVIGRDRNQAEFKYTLNEYISRMIDGTRVAKGRDMKKKYPTLLRRVDQKYGVPPHVILAFWGLESNYGTFKSTHRISDAFLSLIYEGRRAEFFTAQLFALMKHADKNKLAIDSLRGSWAGAMGHFQFIPTTLAQYGKSANADGRIDVINRVSDAMFSAGYFLHRLGWNKDERIVRKVSLPAGFDMSLCDAKTKKPLSAWAAMGVRNSDGGALPVASKSAGMVCDERDNNNVGYLAYDNFYRIKKWNNSNAYAVTVAMLSDRLK